MSASRGQTLNRRTNWCEAETNLLLDLWSDSGIQMELRNFPRNQPVFDRIARVMVKSGFYRTGAQCREKIKTLKKEYKYTKIACDAGGNASNDKNAFRYWEKMEAVLGPPNSRMSTSPVAKPITTMLATAVMKETDAHDTDAVNFNEVITDIKPDATSDGEALSDATAADDEPDVGGNPAVPFLANGGKSRHKRKVIDTSRLEAVIEAAVDKITTVLYETQARLLDFEEKRMKFEAEMESKRRQESRDHEIKLLNSVGQMFLHALELLQRNSAPADSAPLESVLCTACNPEGKQKVVEPEN